jgi:hypothetical protein
MTDIHGDKSVITNTCWHDEPALHSLLQDTSSRDSLLLQDQPIGWSWLPTIALSNAAMVVHISVFF